MPCGIPLYVMVAYQLPTVSLYATSHLDLLISPSNSSAVQDMGHFCISVTPLVAIKYINQIV